MASRCTRVCLLLLSLLPLVTWGQQGGLAVRLDTFSLPGLPGLHSFAFATHEGEWLLMGGRQDGMHPKFGGFGTGNSNQHIRVVNPQTGAVWQRHIGSLPDTLQEQLRSANMAFLQVGDALLFVGGYGRSETVQNHITYPYLTHIHVPSMVAAVKDSTRSLLAPVQQIRDTFFAVTGGQLQQLGEMFYLVGGHRFDGIYSANSTNPTQRYTSAMRQFTLSEVDGRVAVGNTTEVVDELHLHRRDYNLSPHLFEDGTLGLMAFSGVFQPGLALAPFLNIVGIRPQGHSPVEGFSQFLANYHCARLPVYDAAANEMHTLFFGGMSEYWLNEQDSLMQDPRLPFVKTISRVTRLADGTYEEVALDEELPFYTGTGAEFILANDAPTLLHHDIVDYGSLPNGSHLVGYIVGGIVTPAGQRNPFVANTVSITSANNLVIRVYLDKNTTATPNAPLGGQYDMAMRVFPNPTTDTWQVNLQLPRDGRLYTVLQDAQGRIVQQRDWGWQPASEHGFAVSTDGLAPGTYWLTANMDGVYMATRQVVKF